MDSNKRYIKLLSDAEEVHEENSSSPEVKIKATLSLHEMLTFVETVVETCISDDGEYLPEIKEFAIICEIYNRYTDVKLPKDINERYIFIYESTDLTHRIMSEINNTQFNHIIDAINEKIHYRTYTHYTAIKKQTEEIGKLINSFSDLFSDIDKVSIDNLVNAMIDGFNGGDFVNKYVNSLKAGDE